MDLKILIISVILKFTSSMPDPNVNVNVDVHVEDRDGCNGCSLGCVFGFKTYPKGAIAQGACMELQCIKGGVWNYTGNIDNLCGECQAFGDPYIFTYDVHLGQSTAHFYPFMEPGIYSFTQAGLIIPEESEYGVRSSMELCWWTNTCVRSIEYYEPDFKINITLPSFNYTNGEAGDDYYNCFNGTPSNNPECRPKVWVNGIPHTLGNSMNSFYSTDGTVLAFKHYHYGNNDNPYDPEHKYPDVDCINIVGSKGLSVSFCGSIQLSYSNLYVWATTSLLSKPSTLFGLCDTYTGEVRDGYTMQNGTMTNDTNVFGSSWQIQDLPGGNLPGLNRCINETVLAEIVLRCDGLTTGVCKVIPFWQCEGYKLACQYDLCSVGDPDLQAQGYASHFRIHTHLAQ